MPTRRRTTAKKPGREASLTPSTPSTPTSPTAHDIASRAFELFVERGGGHGRDWEDWLYAEHELLHAPPELADSKRASRN